MVQKCDAGRQKCDLASKSTAHARQNIAGAALAVEVPVHLSRSTNRIGGVVTAICACAEVVLWAASTAGGALPGPLPLFPPDNWWNVDIAAAPVDTASANFVAFINNGSMRHMHPDFGGDVSPGSVQIYGFPYAVVDSTLAKQRFNSPTRTRATALTTRRTRAFRFIRFQAKPSLKRTGSKAANRATSISERAAIDTWSSSIGTTVICTNFTTCSTTEQRGTPDPVRSSI